MRTTSQILSAIAADAGSGRSLAELLCVDCTTTLELRGTAMSLFNDAGHQGVIGASGRLAARLEELQFELGEGPSLDASRDNGPVHQPDLAFGAMTRWPGFAPPAVRAGVRSVFAMPLQVGALRLGSICLYRTDRGDLDSDETATASAYADAGLVVLLRLQAQMQPGLTLHPELSEPLEFRAEVHQATGFLSVRASVGLAEALLLLRAHAFASERPLLHVARDVLAGRLHLGIGEAAGE